MKLNTECLRDLLLYLEENLSATNPVIVNNLTLNNYSQEDLIYTADKLREAGFLNCTKKSFDNMPFIMIHSITYQGHQFLDSIRDKNIWTETKAKASKIASVSLPILQEVASTIIKVKLGLS